MRGELKANTSDTLSIAAESHGASQNLNKPGR
jgi:hypothetical protein